MKPIKKTKFIVLLILSIIGAVIIGAGIWAVRFARAVENPWPSQSPGIINSRTPPPDNTTPDPDSTPGITPTPDAGGDDVVVWGKDIINILVIGYDKDEYREGIYSVFRTDTLILATVYYNENRVVLTSVPRDSYVPIANDFTVKDKINAVPYYAQRQNIDVYGAICSTVSRLFGGVPVDYYFAIDMDVFVDVVDELGGIEYDVDVEVRYGDTVLVEKGLQVLDGKKALDYVRFRGTAAADIDRVARQRRFLMAAFSQLKSLDKIVKLPSIYSKVMDRIDTNLTYPQIVNLASFAAGNLNADAITGKTFPGNFKQGVTYWVINQRERVHYIYDLFGITVLPDEQD